ncbi:MAG: hypothetical protein ACRDZP_00610, partial [Acidimicrobiales bacterium]
WIDVKLAHATTAGSLVLSQVLGPAQNRWITKVTIAFDGSHAVTTRLGGSSRGPGGQVVHFTPRRFTTLRITLDGTTRDRRDLSGASGVGFSGIEIPHVHLFEWTKLPTDLLAMTGPSSLSHRLTVVLTRDRVSPIPPRSDPELAMARLFDLPTARTFSLSGTARISALIPDNEIDSLLGGPNVFGGVVVGSNSRLPGDLNARAVFAFDGDPSTFWSPGFEHAAQLGAWTEISLPSPHSFDHMNLQVIADGRHSVPTEIRITSNRGSNVLVHLPPVTDSRKLDSVTTIPLHFRAVRGTVFRFSVVAIRNVTTVNWYSQQPITQPVAIADFGVPGVHLTPEKPSASIPSICRKSLLSVDGHPVWLSVSGSVGSAEHLGALVVRGCGPDAHGLRLGSGEHSLVASDGSAAGGSGIDLDRLVLDSAPGGAPEPLLSSGSVPPVPGSLAGGGATSLPAPPVRLVSSGPDSSSLRLSGVRAGHPFWLVLGESIDRGWTAKLKDGATLGAPVLIDGFANGWYVDPTTSGTLLVNLSFAPEKMVLVAIALSALALLLCLLLALLPARYWAALIAWVTALARLRRPAAAARHRAKGSHGRERDLSHEQRERLPATAVPQSADRPALASPLSGSARPRIIALLLVSCTTALVALVALP